MERKSNVFINFESNSYSIFSLQELLSNGCNGNIVYEFHKIDGKKSKEGLSFFREKNVDNYSNINADFDVDYWPADISYAVEIQNIWYFSLHSGDNSCWGTAPAAVTEFRSFLKNKGIKILAKEGLQEWLMDNFPTHPETAK